MLLRNRELISLSEHSIEYQMVTRAEKEDQVVQLRKEVRPTKKFQK